MQHMLCSLRRYRMPDLKSALSGAFIKKGLPAPPEDVRAAREAEAQRFLDQEARNSAVGKRDSERTRLLAELNDLSSVQKFRALAKKLLLIDPQSIAEVVRIAHARGIREKKKEGGAALIAQLLQTRTALSAGCLSDEAMTRIVKDTISKH